MNRSTTSGKPAGIQWFSQFEYAAAIEAAKSVGLPILLNLHSESSPACRELEATVFADPEVVGKVMQQTIPVRIEVDSTEPNPITSSIVGSHIFIWSQTVQLISPDDDIYHKFIGAPRHTRLDMGYTRVHHDVSNSLRVPTFLLQLKLALAKEALAEGRYERATERLTELLATSPGEDVAHQEAAYWLPIARSHGVYPSQDKRRKTPGKSPIAAVVERLAEALVQIPDSELMLDWHGQPGPGDWAKYSDCLREVVFGTYQAIIDVANKATCERAAGGRPLTAAQLVLKHHQLAYRELQGTTVGLDGAELDAIHLRENFSLGKQRTVRNNLVHCVMAEWWAHTPQIRDTLRATRGDQSAPGGADRTVEEYGQPPLNFGDLTELLAVSEKVHAQLLAEFSNVTDQELDAEAAWWENQPISVRFRLNRLSWHLHDHRAVVETILERLGRKRSETERLATLLFRALGELEGSLLGLPVHEQAQACASLEQTLSARALELETLADSFAESRALTRPRTALQRQSLQHN